MTGNVDRFIELFLNEEGFGPAFARKDVPVLTVEKFRGKLPDQLLEYWQELGWCGYADGLLWTVNPEDWEQQLEFWLGGTQFAEHDKYYVIARSAFGELVLWGTKTGQSLKIVPIYGGLFPAFDAEKFERRGPDKALQFFFGAASRDSYDLKDDRKKSLFEQAFRRLGRLDHDTMYGFVPAFTNDEAVNVERLQILDAHVHLDMLSRVTERQVFGDVAQAMKR